MKLEPAFYLRNDTVEIATQLLGKLLVVQDTKGKRVSGMIVETEAYLGEIDRAAHSYGGRRTARNEVTFNEGGHVYVFFIYGMYHQLNIVTGPADVPHVVLIRALEPIEGTEIMRERRGPLSDRLLASGPGRLTAALGITRTLDGEPMRTSAVTVHAARGPVGITTTARVGITRAVGWPLRFVETGSPWASGPRLTSPRARSRD